MRTRTRVDWAIGVLAAILMIGCQSSGEKTAELEVLSTAVPSVVSAEPSADTSPTLQGKVRPSSEVLPAHFQATVYEVQAVAERLNDVDGKVLAKRAASAEKLLETLSEVGTARILYRFDQPVNVFSETLSIGTKEPVVTGSRITSNGQAIKTVQYQDVGAIIQLSAGMPSKEGKRKGPEVKILVELAVLADSGIEMVPGVKAVSTRNMSLTHKEVLEYGQPRVILAVSSTSTDEKQRPVMYAIRYVFNR